MTTVIDEEFGEVTLRRSARATSVKLSVAPNGTLRASLPLYAPVFLVRRLIKSARPELRHMLEKQTSARQYKDGMQVGKSHSLSVRPTSALRATASRHGLRIVLNLPAGKTISDTDVLNELRKTVAASLRIEAKSYLPKRLKFLAEKYGFSYTTVRFSHASGRWGSCSSNGTISLNIALMMLPFELIDYVLLHELTHTVQMNHSDRFWATVERTDPAYRTHRRALKNESPSI